MPVLSSCAVPKLVMMLQSQVGTGLGDSWVSAGSLQHHLLPFQMAQQEEALAAVQLLAPPHGE
jgi:hypothetical protein